MSDYELKKDQQAQISTRMLMELQMQKYSCYAQEQSCILSINKKELNILSGNVKNKIMEDRLEFIEQIDVFQTLSLSSKLSIVNKLISKTFKLG